MKRRYGLAGLVCATAMAFGNGSCCAACGAANTLTAQERQQGWRLLWDGKTADGWCSVKSDVFPAKGWAVEEGKLTVLPKNEGGGGGDIMTREVFTNFILKVDFRLTPAANSGIKYFFDPLVSDGTTLEYQVLDAAHPDAAQGRDGNRKVASFYDVIPAVGAQPRPLGEWNSAMIVSKGRMIEHWLNGEKMLTFERGSDAFRAAVALSKFAKFPNWGEQVCGHILLQDHNDRVSFRNIKIKILDD